MVRLHSLIVGHQLPRLRRVEAQSQLCHRSVLVHSVQEDANVLQSLIDGHELSLRLKPEVLELQVTHVDD